MWESHPPDERFKLVARLLDNLVACRLSLLVTSSLRPESNRYGRAYEARLSP